MYWFVIVASMGAIVWALMERNRRSLAFRRLASELGFRYCGTSIPSNLKLRDASFADAWDMTSNVISGMYDGLEMAILDYHANHGELGYKQTVVASRSDISVREMTGLWKFSGISAERIGDWVIMFRPKQEIPVDHVTPFVIDCRGLLKSFEEEGPSAGPSSSHT